MFGFSLEEGTKDGLTTLTGVLKMTTQTKKSQDCRKVKTARDTTEFTSSSKKGCPMEVNAFPSRLGDTTINITEKRLKAKARALGQA